MAKKKVDEDVVTMVDPKPRKTKKPSATPTFNEHGFRIGSDSQIIVDIMLKGALDRQDVNDKVAEAIELKTRNGNKKNIPSLVSGLLGRLEERGYYIESYWRLVGPEENEGEDTPSAKTG